MYTDTPVCCLQGSQVVACRLQVGASGRVLCSGIDQRLLRGSQGLGIVTYGHMQLSTTRLFVLLHLQCQRLGLLRRCC